MSNTLNVLDFEKVVRTPFQFSSVSHLLYQINKRNKRSYLKTAVLIISSLSCCGDSRDDTYIVIVHDEEESQQGIYFEEKVISAHLVIVCPNTHHIHESNLSQML